MTQTYRTNDGAKWGSGKGSDLTPAEVDINFWDIIQRLITLEALPDAAAGIDHFTVSGTQFTVVMTDTTTRGPYDLPQLDFTDQGVWQASTPYSVNDTFTINGGLYRVLFAHTSGLTFDAGANDGSGHDYYKLWIQTPGSSLPSGGAAGQVLQKSASTDYTVTWGWKFPTSGTARKYLIQINSTQDNAAWSTPEATDIHFTPVTGSSISSTNVADALEEIAEDAAAALAGGSVIAADVSYTPPTGSVFVSTNVQDVIDEIETTLALGGGASSGSFSATPTGNVSTTEKAMGLGSLFTFTPATTGILVVFIAGIVMNSTAAGDGVTITGRHGNGAVPANGDVGSLGTQFSLPVHFVASTTAGQQGFMVMGKVTGLDIGVTEWFDISIVAVTGGGATVKDVQFIAIETGV
jgi:hypothetical protein